MKQLRSDSLLFALIGLCVAAILVGGTAWLSDPAIGASAGAVILALALTIAILTTKSYPVAAWLFVTGAAAICYGVATLGKTPIALCLLALPAGLAMLMISRMAGFAVAGFNTAILLLSPTSLLPAPADLRVISIVTMWGTLGLIWLTLRPLIAAVNWAWYGYERSTTLLGQAQDYQVQLQQALEDLTSANLQLNRLNQQAQALRQAAEDERHVKERFVANVSHELRTPLNMIIGFCEMITQSPETYEGEIPPTLLADLAVVLRNSQHLSGLIDDVLDLSQVEAGQAALTKERVSLSQVIDAASIAVRPLYTSKGLELVTILPDDLPLVFCDRLRIREVLLNLLSNAGRFTEHGGVQVKAWQEEGDVVISVADTGPGIAQDNIERLFQPFQQADGSIRVRYGGTGLGLAISKGFVELHGGKMWVESEVGRGATFSFRLPINPPAPLQSGVLRWFSPHQSFVERTHPSRLAPPVTRPRVVVVETNGTMQRLLGRYLDNVDVVSAPTVQEAAQQLAQSPAQALIVNDAPIDSQLQRLRECSVPPEGIPAIICSIPGTGQAAGSLGANEYLVKPISREALLSALDRLAPAARSILVIDDEPDALQLFGRMLSSSERSYRVVRASDGRQGLALMQQDPPDAILLDLIMPEMDGFQLLAAKSQAPQLRDIPVILISAQDPFGQPIMSKALAVTCKDGLSMSQVLACIEALTAILARVMPPADPTPLAVPPG
ncbi:MAG: ATP-binding protein [Chloroflexi bacterium]|nr:ATP-binding protein [Chloroflexota bacterium]